MYSFRNPDRRPVSLVNDLPSLTKQSEKDACDINRIMRRYEATGMLEHTSRIQGVFSDVSDAVDYQSALHVVDSATNAFYSLSAKVRKRFNNNPAELLDFVRNPANRKEALDLGLLREQQVELPLAPPPPVDSK